MGDFDKLPVIDRKTFAMLNIPLPNKKAYAFRYSHIYDLVDPVLVELRKKAVVAGEGTDIISFGGDTGEKEIFSILPHDIAKERVTNVYIYDISPFVPEEFTEKTAQYPGVGFTYVSNTDLSEFTLDSRHVDNTRLCSLVAVTDYLTPQEGVNVLELIKKELQPDYFFLGLWLAAPDIEVSRNQLVGREIDEMKQLISGQGYSCLQKLSPIGEDDLLRKGCFSLGWTSKEIADFNLFPGYPGTSFYPISVARYFKDRYDLLRISTYRVEGDAYPREVFFIFKKSS
ncbi:hypothetical protein CO180_04025 [candidate division WWE3 bacterium CG_4_9_14_3_um_filter_41_6]|uniref:Histidine-specific methyltransferase SAM-dependent domain-containing protein n=1 Tax=candidate division WWE3 bacterium CG_4_10_14_0_2_um_filter_41_14 TaxID=1975072 RepID=A0A2M7TGL2_UNCKA|nr:MAG: hypothetical protein COY32_05620 [candidate division WWE3 bacterium CG_4_10_14_0_2_um_filter_41_14]PJA38214.1 MAG: hypothetical protein CO180_04025 [candidate division WWE3 bacterium CG_4_9_14_3_um_filter_41_6]